MEVEHGRRHPSNKTAARPLPDLQPAQPSAHHRIETGTSSRRQNPWRTIPTGPMSGTRTAVRTPSNSVPARRDPARKELEVPNEPDTLPVRVATPGNMARRVLVVDDETVVGETVTRLLALDHHEVETATSGQDAMLAFQRSKFDLIIVDYQMPGMKGDEVAAAIKALAPRQPIIMMTAYGETLRLAGSFPLAVDLVIRKPFDVQGFREAVRQLTEKT